MVDPFEAAATVKRGLDETLRQHRNFMRDTREAEETFANDAVEIPVVNTDLRLSCLRVAADVAKLGLVANVYETADRYFRFVIGEPVDDPTAGLSFEARLDLLASEFLSTNRSDGRAIKHALATFYERMDNAYPDLPASSSVPRSDYLDTLDAANRSPR